MASSPANSPQKQVLKPSPTSTPSPSPSPGGMVATGTEGDKSGVQIWRNPPENAYARALLEAGAKALGIDPALFDTRPSGRSRVGRARLAAVKIFLMRTGCANAHAAEVFGLDESTIRSARKSKAELPGALLQAVQAVKPEPVS